MSQKDKARAIIERDYEFRKPSSKSPQQVAALASEAAAASQNLRGRIVSAGSNTSTDGTVVSHFVMQGPGGLMDIMDFTVSAAPTATGSNVSLSIGNFLFQKGSFGLKPSINGASLINKYSQGMRAAL